MQATQPIQFGDFVSTYGGNTELGQDVPSSFYTSVGAFYFPKSTYVKKEFSKDSVAGAVSAIVRTTIETISIDAEALSRENYFKMVEAFGFQLNADKETALKAFLFDRAATFQFCPYGTCAWRACYAGLKLIRVFQNSNLQVFVEAAKIKDHFTVMLGSKVTGWFVYDPLTNPDVVFPVDLYNKEIIPTFSDRRSTAERFSLKITPALAEAYENAWPRIQKLYLETCRAAKLDPKKLVRDPAFSCLRLDKVPSEQHLELCKKAIAIFDEIVKKQQIT